MDPIQLSIKQMAETTDVSEDTLRYYERIGLIDPVARANNGHRRYGALDIRRVDFLKRLRATGMPIKDMQRYVQLFRIGESTIVERRVMLEQHRQLLNQQIDTLLETRTLLDTKIENYRLQEAQHQNGEDS